MIPLFLNASLSWTMLMFAYFLQLPGPCSHLQRLPTCFWLNLDPSVRLFCARHQKDGNSENLLNDAKSIRYVLPSECRAGCPLGCRLSRCISIDINVATVVLISTLSSSFMLVRLFTSKTISGGFE